MLTVGRIIKENAHKHIVGGCALPQWWLDLDPESVDRVTVLKSMNLDPERPTFFHAARFATSHKGQLELMRAIDAVLATDRDVNFVVRCALGAAGDSSKRVGNLYMQEVAARYPQNVYLDWHMVDERLLFEHAAAADFCIFPSKNETDAFLITQGEAMACGAVPIATAQEVTRHFAHDLSIPHPDATGFSVRRSFRRDDPRLTAELVQRIHEALSIFRNEPETYRRISANSRRLARTFTWQRCAQTRIDAFTSLANDRATPLAPQVAIRYGWFERLGDAEWRNHRDAILQQAEQFGDLDAYRRCADVDDGVIERCFAAAFARADFERCKRTAAFGAPSMLDALSDRCRAHVEGNQLHVEYCLATAECVDLFFFDPACDEPRGMTQQSISLRRCGTIFRGIAPMYLDGRVLIFMVTLRSGRVTWDCVRPTQSFSDREALPLVVASGPRC